MAVTWHSFAHAAAASTVDPVVNKPSGTVAGDLLVAVVVCSGGGTVATPSGWTLHPNSLGAQKRLFYKVAGASEPSTYTFDVSGTLITSVAVISRYSGQHASTPIDVASGIDSGTGASIVIPTLTSSGSGRLLAQIVAKLANTTMTPPGTATERWDATTAGTVAVTAGGDETVGAGATGSRTWTAGAATGTGVGYMLAIAPAPPISGDVAGTTPAATAALTGELDGVLAGSSPVGTAALTGVLPGDVAAQSASAVAALVGDLLGDLGPSSPRAVAGLEGTYTPPHMGDGILAGPTPATVAALAGSYADPPGDLTGTTPALAGALTGSLVSQFAGTTFIPTAALAGTYADPIVGNLAGTTPAVRARLRERGPRQHTVTVRERPRTHAIADVSRSHTIADASRTTTIREGIA